jgi:hypothetical protein
MEKRRPTYDLEAIKLAIGSIDTLAITTSALRTATCSGFDRGAIVEVIQSIERPMFFVLQVDDNLRRSPRLAGRLPRSRRVTWSST